MAAQAAVAAVAEVVRRGAEVQRRTRAARDAARETARVARRARRVAGAPAAAVDAVADSAGATTRWVTAPVGERRRMPFWIKCLLVLLLFLYVPWTVMQRVPDLRVLPGLPLTWGHLFSWSLPDLRGVLPEDTQDHPFSGSSSCSPAPGARGPSFVPAAGVTPAGDAGPPWLTSLARAAGESVREDIVDPENVKAFGLWVFDLTRAGVGAAADGFLGADAPSEHVAAYDEAWVSRTQASGVHPVCAAPGGGGAAVVPASVGACPPSGSGAERGLSPRALMVLRCGAASFPELSSFGGVGSRGNRSDHPHGNAVDLMVPGYQTPQGQALGSRVADFYVANADVLNVRYVIWADRIWNPGRGWRPYKHPICSAVGCGGDTLRHLDHVHVSVEREGVSV